MVSDSITAISDVNYLANELACYLIVEASEITLAGMQAIELQYGACYSAFQYHYQLPLGTLELIVLTLSLPTNISLAEIKAARMAVTKSVLVWHKVTQAQYIRNNSQEQKRARTAAFVMDIQLTEVANEHKTTSNQSANQPNHVQHAFGVRYFLEDLVVDVSESEQPLQAFSWHDWDSVLLTLQTPCELWRFLRYRLQTMRDMAIDDVSEVTRDAELLSHFLHSEALFAPAIEVDNALINYQVQDKPNPALVAMTLAYKNKSTTAQMYQQHMQQAAILWSQLSTQMMAAYDETQTSSDSPESSELPRSHWQQQLLDESLFSRHELVRTLYRHPKQSAKLQQDGYVVHQHSYECLGRHYMLIFYGQEAQATNSKAAIQPNLAKIAQDVATRLPIHDLHHVIVLGIDFIMDGDERFIDIDVWIQPVDAMTQRERQLTKQIQQLKKQNAHTNSKQTEQRTERLSTDQLPQVRLNISIPSRKKE